MRDLTDDQMECYLATYGAAYYPSAGHTSEGIVVEAAWLQHQDEFDAQKVVLRLILGACEAEDGENII